VAVEAERGSLRYITLGGLVLDIGKAAVEAEHGGLHYITLSGLV